MGVHGLTYTNMHSCTYVYTQTERECVCVMCEVATGTFTEDEERTKIVTRKKRIKRDRGRHDTEKRETLTHVVPLAMRVLNHPKNALCVCVSVCV